MQDTSNQIHFYGTTVVRAAFVLAVFGWGVGFYGPPIFLHAVLERGDWSLSTVSAAITFHFLLGAGVNYFMPHIHQRFGIPRTTIFGSVVLAIGIVGWAIARNPWQLFGAAAFTGAGWVPMGATGINAIISRWYSKKRPLALAMAYNGASVGGMVFSPLWVALIQRFDFLGASLMIALVMVTIVFAVATRVFSQSPADKGQHVDGDSSGYPDFKQFEPKQHRKPAPILWYGRPFTTLAVAMALGLFAQIGLLSQLFQLLAPIYGVQTSGWLITLATALGMTGRLVNAQIIGRHSNRRNVASASYAVQAVGTLLFCIAGVDQLRFVTLGVIFFGLGIGNATSMPALIAQSEFDPQVASIVLARCVAFSQATYAFAPLVFSMLLPVNDFQPGRSTSTFFIAVLAIQCTAILFMLAGRNRSTLR